MLFNSIEYLILLGLSLCCYWMLPWLLGRQLVLFFASVYFYMSWSRIFVLLLLGAVGLNWVLGQILEKKRHRIWMLLAVISNLSVLGYFKYAQFLTDNLYSVLGWFKEVGPAPSLAIILPLGISFFVFELISYVVDIYKGRVAHEKNPIAFALFVLFFPHLIAGPICRAGQFLPQVKSKKPFDPAIFFNGVYQFLCGFVLKTAIADGIAPFVNVIFGSPERYSGFDSLCAMVGFGVQIFSDFWGYSLMALGAALMFGITLPANFNQPYSACTIRDFWRRWHITLSNWLRDYLYIALGGSRVSTAWRLQLNLLLTMLLGGLWHGANWTFIVWGAIHGGALAVHRWYEGVNLPSGVRAIFSHRWVSWVLTMTVVFVAWVFFRARNFHDAAVMLERIFFPHADWWGSKLSPEFFELLLLFLPVQFWVHRTTNNCDVTSMTVWKPAVAVAVLAAIAVAYYVDGNDFIYFQF